MKKNRHGKAAIFKSHEIIKIRKALGLGMHRAIFEIALFTGERIGAILQLSVDDVFNHDASLREKITFKKRTRKNKDATRQVDIHPDLASFLLSWEHKSDGYLFPSYSSTGHITYNAVYLYWQEIFSKCGLDHRGFSCHSTRRWFITQLVENGTDIATVQQITGHKNTGILLGYVAENEKRRKNAIASISIAA